MKELDIQEALKLADELLRGNTQLSVESAYMIRRLVEELDRLDYDLKALVKLYKELNKTKPLSDEEIIDIWFEIGNAKNLKWQQINFARAIEERHGIK